MEKDRVSFSFGENWRDYVETVRQEDVERAKRDIEEWLGADAVRGKTVVDVGCGSGIHSLAFRSLGARTISSFDADHYSVEATRVLWEREGQPENWSVSRGSVLDKEYVASYGQYDIVYSWGVLHHTGAMWQAVENVCGLVKPGGVLWISLYTKGPRYPKDLALKQKYNSASRAGKRWMICRGIGRLVLSRLKHFKNPFTWNQKRERGMNAYHDLVDWLGGLPYEVASEDDVVRFGRKAGFVLERINAEREGGCSIYVFSRPPGTEET